MSRIYSQSIAVPSATLIGGLLLAACASSSDLDIGDDVAQTGLQLSDYAADWDGYAEAMVFNDTMSAPDGDRIRLSIAADGTGTLRVGNSALLAPPTAESEPIPLMDPVFPTQLLSGVEYPISDALVEDRRLRLKVNLFQPWNAWCVVQEPIATDDPDKPYSCFSHSRAEYDFIHTEDDYCAAIPTGTDGTIQEPVSCGRYEQCLSHEWCYCTATACQINTGASVAELDAALTDSASALEGTLVIDDERITVRMER